MFKKLMKFLRRLILRLSLFGLLALFIPRIITSVYAAAKIFTVETVSADRVAIVFGAEVKKDGIDPATLVK
jgi:vancomycin permeability regulator SanA